MLSESLATTIPVAGVLGSECKDSSNWAVLDPGAAHISSAFKTSFICLTLFKKLQKLTEWCGSILSKSGGIIETASWREMLP